MIGSYLLKLTDSLFGSALCRLVSLLDFILRRDSHSVFVPPGDTCRLLVIRPGGMGDMAVLLPVLRCILKERPGWRMDILCEKRNAGILGLTEFGGNILAYDSRPAACLLRVMRAGYDIVLDTEQFHNFSAVLAYLTGAAIRIGFNINPRRNPLYTHLVNYDPGGPEPAQFARLIEPLSLGAQPGPVTGILAGAVREIPGNVAAVCGNRPYAVLHAGASTRYKRWPAENFAILAQTLAARHGMAAILVGNGHDRAVSAEIAAHASSGGPPAVAASFAGTLRLHETVSVIGNARLFVGGDSGLAHLAVAAGTPTVVLFGPSDHVKWGVEDSGHAVVRTGLPCAPCFIFGYHKPCRSIECMKRITVDRAIEACERVLGIPLYGDAISRSHA